ncbi:MAG TPA: ROK family protein [Nocardioides sp.]|nr:ROK family protein [Nocardioides sp.]
MYVGVDVGGTKVLAVEISESGAVVRTARDSTPGRGDPVSELEDALTRAVEAVRDGRELTAVGVSAAALVEPPGEVVRFAPHLPWREDHVRDRLAARWGTRVVLDNDAHCAAEAELAIGAGRDAGSFLLVNIGTGIGGGLVLDGRVWRGAGGMAGEFGHMQVVPDGLACECGLRGCWEQYCSGRALERVVRVGLGSHLDGPQVTERAQAGDELARQAFATIGTWLGVGLANLVAAFDPALLVVGGGVSSVGDLLLEPAREALARSLVAAPHRTVPPIVPAALGSEAGAIGAALLARRSSGVL